MFSLRCRAGGLPNICHLGAKELEGSSQRIQGNCRVQNTQCWKQHGYLTRIKGASELNQGQRVQGCYTANQGDLPERWRRKQALLSGTLWWWRQGQFSYRSEDALITMVLAVPPWWPHLLSSSLSCLSRCPWDLHEVCTGTFLPSILRLVGFLAC
jgi:hypothetical protein